MYSSTSAANRYATVQKEALDPRSLDAMVLVKAAHRLESLVTDWDSIDSREGLEVLAEALRYNQRLWTVYQTELSSPDNSLPSDLRRNLLALSGYVDSCTMQVLAAPDQAKVRTLIHINRWLAEGLVATPNASETLPAGGANGEGDILDLQF